MCVVKIINKLLEYKYDYVFIENSHRVFIANMEELIKVVKMLNIPTIVISKEFFEITPNSQKFLITTTQYLVSNNTTVLFDADEYAAYKLGDEFVLTSLQEIADKYLYEGKYLLRRKMLARMHNIKIKRGVI